MNNSFKSPDRPRKPIIVSVPTRDYDPLAHRGALRSPSPEEVIHAFLLAVHRDFKGNASDDVMKEWRKAALTVTFNFKLHEKEDSFYWEAVNSREDLVTDFTDMVRTGLQNVMEIISFKKSKETSCGKLTAKGVSDMYKANARISEHSEEIADNFVDNCLTVWNRALKLPNVFDIVNACDAEYGARSPWNGVIKLWVLVARARIEESITWCFESLKDKLDRKLLKPEDISKRTLVGEKGQRGLVDLDMCKRDMLQYMLSNMLDIVDLTPVQKEKTKEAPADHASCAKFVAKHPASSVQPDLSWQVYMTPSQLQLINMIHETVYGSDYDSPLKTGVKNQKAPEDILGYQAAHDMTCTYHIPFQTHTANIPCTQLPHANTLSGGIRDHHQRYQKCSRSRTTSPPWRNSSCSRYIKARYSCWSRRVSCRPIIDGGRWYKCE